MCVAALERERLFFRASTTPSPVARWAGCGNFRRMTTRTGKVNSLRLAQPHRKQGHFGVEGAPSSQCAPLLGSYTRKNAANLADSGNVDC